MALATQVLLLTAIGCGRFGSVLVVGFSLAYCLGLSWKLTLLGFGTFPFIAYLAKVFGKCFADLAERTQAGSTQSETHC